MTSPDSNREALGDACAPRSAAHQHRSTGTSKPPSRSGKSTKPEPTPSGTTPTYPQSERTNASQRCVSRRTLR